MIVIVSGYVDVRGVFFKDFLLCFCNDFVSFVDFFI